MTQPSSGSTLSEEIIKYVQIKREKIDRIRHGTASIRVIDGVIFTWSWAVEERRGKEIDFL